MACMVLTMQAFGQSGQTARQGYYVVINAYAESREDAAARYFEQIREDGDEVHYAYVPSKKMYFVYRQFHEDFQQALSDMRSARKDPRFPEAWVFVSGEHQVTNLDAAIPVAAQQNIEENTKGNTDQSVTSAPAEVQPDPESEENREAMIDEDAFQELEAELEPPANVQQVVFILSNARNNEEVQGKVQVIDAERAKLLGVQQAGEIAAIEDPDNGTGNLTFLCDVFGYRKLQKEVNYNGLDESEDIQRLDDYYVVFFDLVRYHKGDIVTMYNVYFFNDAAVMRPESRYEVNSLLEMMRENPNYKIRIHGHTNGNRGGKIIAMGDSEAFFQLNEKNKQGSGSAKMLSKRRAELIRDYLISQGIDGDRMEIKAWGGRRMLYDKNSSMAKRNVRVEIEILEE